MGLYEDRVKRLREHVLRQQKKTESPEPTNAELKKELEELGIEYDKRANKATLLALLKEAQGKEPDEDQDDGEGAE